MLPDDTVPIWRVLLVKDGLHVLGNVLFCVLLVHDRVDLLLELGLHLFAHLADDVVDYSVSAHFSFVCWLLACAFTFGGSKELQLFKTIELGQASPFKHFHSLPL